MSAVTMSAVGSDSDSTALRACISDSNAGCLPGAVIGPGNGAAVVWAV